MSWNDRFYMGTWQFGGQFRKITTGNICKLLECALTAGVSKFDTALVYGNGEVEKILGDVLPKNAVIVTKIPSIRKPELSSAEKIDGYYNYPYMAKCIAESLKHLKRATVGTVLLHNWIPSWNSEDSRPIIAALNRIKNSGLASKVGISLPNGFATQLPRFVMEEVDVVEAPFNCCEQWILGQLGEFAHAKKEVIFRSIFLQGILLMNPEQRASVSEDDVRKKQLACGQNFPILNARDALLSAWRFGTSVTVGMTSPLQLSQNIELLKGDER